MIEQAATVVDGIGVVVGLGALSLSVWTLAVHRELFDAPYVAALYIVGTIIVFLSFEVNIDPHLGALFGRITIFAAVGFWEVVIFREVKNLEIVRADE